MSSTDVAAEIRRSEADFFAALLAADTAQLSALLAPDFRIVDVMSGQVADRDAFVSAVDSGDLRFLDIVTDGAAAEVRTRGTVGIAIGTTSMRVNYLGTDGASASRYTHVYVHEGAGWQLLSAQGTPMGTSSPGSY